MCVALTAQAGNQVEEHLADSVRTALSASVSGLPSPQPYLPTAKDQQAYERWMTTQQSRLTARLKTWHGSSGLPELASTEQQRLFLQTLWYESHRAALDPSLVLGVVEVESGFRQYAISSAGAMGVMQVMPFWARLIGDGEASRLFHMQTNLRFGCTILRHYLGLEHGHMFMALGRYNGSRGRAEYPDRVMQARRDWV